MPGESKRVASPRGRPSEGTGRRPRTRSMTHKQTEDEAHHSPRIPEGGATGSEINNEAPDSNDSPSPSTRKKPRHSTCEITEEPGAEETPPPNNTPRVVEQRVYWFSQYLTLRLWRAVEGFEVWDSSLVRAFREGPRSFALRVNGAARGLTRRLIGSGRADLDPEAVTQSYLNRFRPRGLYGVCARIFQRKSKEMRQNERPLKRKKPDSETQEELWTFPEEHDAKKFKHRFLMAPPRLIVLSGPDKEIDGDVEMGE